ncbi:MAG: ATP-binding protein [Lentisphaeria bacterium]|nr:ATP-binding protein [Lentisphaeria bacterium]MBR7119945.1 ATP-binding protein [Lentisphaeria bacterium]
MLQRINAAGIPPEFRNYDPERGNPAMLEWIASNSEKNILLMSEVNTGKTRALCKVLLDAVKSGIHCRYADFVDLSSEYSGAKKESTTAAQRVLKRILRNYDILFVDDIDKQKLTETTGELLYKIFNAVYSGTARCRIWATMNHSGVEFMKRFENADQGAAVLSRIERMMTDARFAVKHF